MELNKDKCAYIAMNKFNHIKFEDGSPMKCTQEATYLGSLLTEKAVTQ